ncbi:hypothetical protein [Plantactinospora sp. B5E13]|uniref:hypothetical protein n=1 Tax=unclassified Plantactinospora TaxID=2631981 RepID=UPI00325DB659
MPDLDGQARGDLIVELLADFVRYARSAEEHVRESLAGPTDRGRDDEPTAAARALAAGDVQARLAVASAIALSAVCNARLPPPARIPAWRTPECGWRRPTPEPTIEQQ